MFVLTMVCRSHPRTAWTSIWSIKHVTTRSVVQTVDCRIAWQHPARLRQMLMSCGHNWPMGSLHTGRGASASSGAISSLNTASSNVGAMTLQQCLWLSMLVLTYSTRHLSARSCLTTDCCKFWKGSNCFLMMPCPQ